MLVSVPFSAQQFETKPNRLRRVRVRVDKLVPTQVNFDARKVDDIARRGVKKEGTDPLVHSFDGQYYVSDGHHRALAAARRGDSHIWVRKAP
jgi:ParB-like chromosome segregation protein Spo0J